MEKDTSAARIYDYIRVFDATNILSAGKKNYIYLYIILKIWLCEIVINDPVLQNLKGQNWVLAAKSELEMWHN